MLESIQNLSAAVATTFFILSTSTILLRIYSRRWVVKSFGWDDWCMVSILFFNAGHQAILYYFIKNGGGLRVEKVMTEHPQWMQNLVNALFAEEIMYSWMHFVIKMAFLLFYLRFATLIFRKLVYVTMGINGVFTLVNILIYCFQCRPLDAFFYPLKYPEVKCLDNSVLAFVPAAFSIFVDVLIVILPIQPLWAIQVSLRKRVALITIICLGGIVVLISCIRLVVLLEFQKKDADFTYVLGKLIIISSIELEVAIMAANAPSLKILAGKWFNNSSLTSKTSVTYQDGDNKDMLPVSSSSRRGAGGFGGPKNNKKGGFNGATTYAVDCSNYVPMSSTMPKNEAQRRNKETQDRAGSRTRDRANMSSDSVEQLWKHDNGIMVTSSLEVQSVIVEPPQAAARSHMPRTPSPSAATAGKERPFVDQYDAV